MRLSQANFSSEEIFSLDMFISSSDPQLIRGISRHLQQLFFFDFGLCEQISELQSIFNNAKELAIKMQSITKRNKLNKQWKYMGKFETSISARW